jgi:predicted membrane metal-binding protein
VLHEKDSWKELDEQSFTLITLVLLVLLNLLFELWEIFDKSFPMFQSEA